MGWPRKAPSGPVQVATFEDLEGYLRARQLSMRVASTAPRRWYVALEQSATGAIVDGGGKSVREALTRATARWEKLAAGRA